MLHCTHVNLVAFLINSNLVALLTNSVRPSNSSGVDPSPDQWRGILKVAKEKGFLPFFDSAYQVHISGLRKSHRVPLLLMINLSLLGSVYWLVKD